jgi:hypothetical protein
MGEIFEDDVVRMIGRPAFTPEYAVGLRKLGNNAGFRIVSLTLTKPLQYSEPITMADNGQLQMPPLPWKRKLNRCEMPIGNRLGERITEVWRKMLMRTRYSAQYTAGLDGATFEFSMFVRGLGPISGKVWLPERDSSTGTLVALADEMYDTCTKKKSASIASAEVRSTNLQFKVSWPTGVWAIQLG